MKFNLPFISNSQDLCLAGATSGAGLFGNTSFKGSGLFGYINPSVGGYDHCPSCGGEICPSCGGHMENGYHMPPPPPRGFGGGPNGFGGGGFGRGGRRRMSRLAKILIAVAVILVVAAIAVTVGVLVTKNKKEAETQLVHGTVYYYTAENVAEKIEVEDGGLYTLPVPSKVGYTFKGYYSNAQGSGAQYVNETGMCVQAFSSGTETLVLFPVFRANSYTIFFNSGEGKGLNTERREVEYGETLAPFESGLTMENGYEFDGWFTAPNGEGVRLTDAEGNFKGGNQFTVENFGQFENTSVTFFAHYVLKNVTITLKYKNGITETRRIAYGSEIGDNFTPEHSTVENEGGCTVFIGWAGAQGSNVLCTDPLTANRTLFEIRKPVARFKNSDVEDMVLTVGGYINLSYDEDDVTNKPAGKTFIGWQYNGVIYKTGDTLLVAESGFVFTPVFQ